MKTETVIVKQEENWAGNKYLTYSTKEDGKIAELDYPDEYHQRPRVFALNIREENEMPQSVSFSSIPMAMVGAETVVKGFLYDKGILAVSFLYPKTVKMR